MQLTGVADPAGVLADGDTALDIIDSLAGLPRLLGSDPASERPAGASR
jgi:hypothetical protein